MLATLTKGACSDPYPFRPLNHCRMITRNYQGKYILNASYYAIKLAI